MNVDVFGGIVIGVSISMTAVFLNWIVKEKYGEEYAFGFYGTENDYSVFRPRQEIKELSYKVVDSIEWTPRTVSKGITNVNFTHDDTEYRAVLTIETIEHFRDRKDDED